MLKRIVLAMIPVFMVAATVSADDGLFNLDVSSISDADIEIQEVNFDGLDVEKLAGETDAEDSEEAVERVSDDSDIAATAVTATITATVPATDRATRTTTATPRSTPTDPCTTPRTSPCTVTTGVAINRRRVNHDW